MEKLKSKSAVVAAVTLIVGIALGIGISTWTTRTHAAAPTKRTTVEQNDEPRSIIAGSNEWDPFAEMDRMQEEINRVMRRATDQFRMNPGLRGFRREMDYSSSLDLRDRKDHFEVRAYLPDTEISDVKVTTEDDRTLRVSMEHRKQQKQKESGTESSVNEFGRYEQLVTLPEPVISKEMKVERKDHELVITLPKAKTT